MGRRKDQTVKKLNKDTEGDGGKRRLLTEGTEEAATKWCRQGTGQVSPSLHLMPAGCMVT